MANQYFNFKQFTIMQEHCAMKVTTDACLFGAWAAVSLGIEKSILDIGTGTGLLSLMVAQQSNATIHSVEIERVCFNELKSNIESSPWENKIKAYCCDICTFDEDVSYDLIISNPPFYEHQLRSPKIATNLARHSDQLTLTTFFENAKRLLRENGRIFLLMPFYRKNEILSSAHYHKLYPAQVADVKQSTKHDAFRTMISFSTIEQEIISETITIKDQTGSYTCRFRELLSEYYLNL